MPTIVVANPKGGCGKSTIARSLADVLNADIVDLDHQKTLTLSARIAGRKLPVSMHDITARYVVYDTPPYHDETFKSLFQSADVIVIPVKSGYADLLATKSVYDDLKSLKMIDKAIIVFNEVRKPINKTHQEVVRDFRENYPLIRVANTQLSNLLGFKRVLAEELFGLACEQMHAFLKELNI